MKVTLEGNPKEIAALVLAVQERQNISLKQLKQEVRELQMHILRERAAVKDKWENNKN